MSDALHALPAGVRFAASVAALGTAFLVLYRAAFWAAFRRTTHAVPARDILRALWIGVRFDLRLALLLALPALLLGGFPGALPGDSSLATALWWTWISGTFALVTLVHLVDLAHYDYLHCRVDATVVEHLDAPDIALKTGWESFPVLRGAAVLLVAVGLHALLVQQLVLRPLAGHGAWPAAAAATDGPASARLAEPGADDATGSAAVDATATAADAASASPRAAGSPPPAAASGAPAAPAWPWWSGAALLFAWGLHGRTKKFPLRWSDAFFTPSPFVAALALQPVLFVLSTWDNRRTACDEDAVREGYPELAAALGVEHPDAATLSFARPLRPRGSPPRTPNVVIVIVESFAGYKVGLLGNPLDPTPCLDALGRRSLLFDHHFAVTPPTARAVFTLLTGVPDVNAVHSASRNPMAVRQPTLVNAFAGHDKMYFIGGSASWGNIRGVLAHNIPDVQIFEEGFFEGPRVDGWGVSDRQLFAEANAVFRRQERPFVAVVHTSGNHRPWTIPKDRGDFELRQVDAATLRSNGFDSLEEFNSWRFLDHSIGHFVELARAERWYEDTLFLVLGDHGAGAPHDVPWERLGLTHVHTPLVVHGPAFTGPPRTVDTVMSSVDVLPTALSLAGIACENPTLGNDVFDARRPEDRFAFVRIPSHYGLVGGELFLSMHRKTREAALYAYRSSDPCRDVSAEHPDERARMHRLCAAYFETARWLLHRGR